MYLSNVAGIPLTHDLGRYLGVPSLHGRVYDNLFDSVLERMRGRLEGWRSRFFSLAGREVLAQSILSAIPLYSMQTFLLPKGLCMKIEKIIRSFLWGGSCGERRMSLVAWEEVTKRKEDGGLGIRGMHEMNLAFLAKLGWRLMNNDSSLWAQLLCGKYMKGSMVFTNIVPKQKASNAWLGIVAPKDVLLKGLRMRVRNGRKTYFWLDTWIGDQALIEVCLHELPLVDMYKRVRDYW